ncbi:hypothetical protein [Pedobacter sp. NJ-S-72]
MKKNIIYIFCCITLLSGVLSCTTNKNKDKSGSNKEAGSNISSAANGPADQASRIIEYTNLVVDMANSHNSYLKNILSNTNQIEFGLKNPKNLYAFAGIITPHIIRAGLRNMNGVTIEKPVDELGKENQTYFKTQKEQI